MRTSYSKNAHLSNFGIHIHISGSIHFHKLPVHLNNGNIARTVSNTKVVSKNPMS